MIVAKLSISYDRGTSLNNKNDLGVAVKKGDVTVNGGIVRGLGSHFRSHADMLATKERDKEASRIYTAFRAQFMTTTIDGLYIVPEYGAAKKFVDDMGPVGINVSVAEFELTTPTGLDEPELLSWGTRIKRQLSSVSLGRKKNQVDEAGLKAVEALADCPLLTKETRDAVKNLTGLLRTNTIDRMSFRKRLESLNVKVQQIDEAYAQKAANAEKSMAWAK
jgi:hypothetical protein